MARLTTPLNNTQIEKAKPKEKEYTLADGKGLYLLVKPNGAKLWRFNYYKPYANPKKRALIGIGSYPDISLQQARQIKDEYNALLARNIDPQLHKQEIKLTEQNRLINTFAYVAEQWKASKEEKIKAETLAKSWRIIEIYLLPQLSNMPIDKIIPAIVKPVLDVPYKANKAEMFRKSMRLLNEVLDYAVNALFILPLNPCANIKKAFEPPSRGEFAYIPFEELPDFLDKLQNSNINLLTRYLIQWQLLTMVRANEAVTAEYADIDEDKRLWIIPPEKMKQGHGGKPHIVPLSKQAYALLQKIKAISNGNGYLFPSTRSKEQTINKQSANKAISDQLGYKNRLTAHGLRKIASSYLHEKGVLPDVVELCLAHTIGGLRGVYNKAEYLPQRKQAMQLWGDYVGQCMTQATAKHLRIVA